MTAYMRPKAAAAMLDVSVKLIYKLIDSGELRAIRVGRCVRILAESLQDFIRRNATGGDSPPPVSSPSTPQKPRHQGSSGFVFLPPKRS